MRVLRPPASTSPYSGGAVVRPGASAVATELTHLARERTPSAGLCQQAHAHDLDVVRARLAHVVDRQRRDGRAGQRLHLNSRAMVNRCLAAYDDVGAALMLDMHL